MREVSGSKPDGAQDKKRKKTGARSLGNMEEKKRGKKKIGEKPARDVARESAQSNPLLFVR